MTGLTDNQIQRLRCGACGQRNLAHTKQRYEREISHDGRPPVKIVIPDLEVVACMNSKCPPDHPDHSVIWDDPALWRITIETYRQLGLLTPNEIRSGRERLGRTQQELQELLGLGGNTLSRWESGRVYQSWALDTLLRLVFRDPTALLYIAKVERPARTAKKEAESLRRFPYLNPARPPLTVVPKPDEFFAICGAA
ncbi:MAG: type II toxin-antitoxin system MqsA family antitoxin [Planctomycetes bacterium]|nr:type II toxin-antitoxin system MqsA family antitoxin [Planctomycetota bacterium]